MAFVRAEAASEKTDAAIEKAEETARLLEEAVKRRSAQREAEMSPAVKNADAFPDVKEAGVSEAEGETHRAKNELSNPSQEKRESFLHRIISWFKQKMERPAAIPLKAAYPNQQPGAQTPIRPCIYRK